MKLSSITITTIACLMLAAAGITRAQDKQASFGKTIQLVASGALKAKVDSRFSLEDIKAAVTRAAQPGRNGKVLLMPQMAAEPVRKTSFLANLGFGKKD